MAWRSCTILVWNPGVSRPRLKHAHYLIAGQACACPACTNSKDANSARVLNIPLGTSTLDMESWSVGNPGLQPPNNDDSVFLSLGPSVCL